MNQYNINPQVTIRVAQNSFKKIISLLNKFQSAKNETDMKSVLYQIEQNEDFYNSLSVASNDLISSLNSIDTLSNKQLKSTFKAIYKYLLRSFSRATPYGLFASVQNINIYDNDNDKNINLNKKIVIKDRKQHIEVSSEFLFSIYDRIIDNLECFENMTVFLNGNIIEEKEMLKMFIIGENPNQKDGDFLFYKKDGVMFLIYRFLSNSKSDVEVIDIIHIIKNVFSDVSYSDIYLALKELLRDRFIFLEAYPQVYSTSGLDTLCIIVEKYNRRFLEKCSLKEISLKIKDYEVAPSPEKLKDIYNLMSQVALCKNYLVINSELIIPDNSYLNLNLDYINDISNILGNISQLPSRENIVLDDYRDKFIEQYGFNNPVYILELFDEIKGLGSPFRLSKTSFSKLDKYEKFKENLKEIILKKASEAEGDTVQITDKDFQKILNEEYMFGAISQRNNGFDLNFKVLNIKSNTTFLFSNAPVSLNPGNFSGRFTFLKQVNNIAEDFVGINYWPYNNVLWDVNRHTQKNVRHIEVHKKVKNETNINLSDVRICLNTGGIFEILDKENNVIRLDSQTMGNTLLKNDIIRFLELISSDSHNIQFLINELQYIAARFSKRLQYGNIIITPRMWAINADYLNTLVINKADVKTLVEKLKIPNEIVLTKGDKLLPLNLSNNIDQQIFIKEIYKNKGIVITENIVTNPSELIVDGDGHSYTSEISISLLNRSHKSKINYNVPVLESTSSYSDKINLFDGTKGWIYTKMYVEIGMQDNLLLEKVDKFISNYNVKWFYIRYRDDRPHIRLRIKINDNDVILVEYFNWLSQLVDLNLISDYSINIYHRELERYGGLKHIDDIESIFMWDSLLTLDLLKARKHLQADYFYALVIKVMCCLIDNISHDKELYYKIFEVESLKDKKIKKKYDRIRPYISHIKINQDTLNKVHKLTNLFNKVAYSIKKDHQMHYSTEGILNSIVHMHYNRLFGDNSKEQEFRAQIHRYLKMKKYYQGNHYAKR